MKTRAKDRIALSSGREATLGEALDQGLVELRDIGDGRFVAREVDGDLFWDVRRTLFESRKRLLVSVARVR